MHVAVEDRHHDRRLGVVDLQSALAFHGPVSDGLVSAAPAPLGGLALHAGDDPVDDGGPLELGEHPEHLDHHATGGGLGVEGLGGRSEGHAGGVEVLDDLGQAPDAAREPVGAVDEQDVEATGSGLGQGPAQPRALQGGPRELVGEAGDVLPAFLAGHVGAPGAGPGLRASRAGGPRRSRSGYRWRRARSVPPLASDPSFGRLFAWSRRRCPRPRRRSAVAAASSSARALTAPSAWSSLRRRRWAEGHATRRLRAEGPPRAAQGSSCPTYGRSPHNTSPGPCKGRPDACHSAPRGDLVASGVHRHR